MQDTEPIRHTLIIICLLVMVTVIGVAGFWYLEGLSLFEAFFLPDHHRRKGCDKELREMLEEMTFLNPEVTIQTTKTILEGL